MRKPWQLAGLPDIPTFGAFLHRLVIVGAFLALASPSVGPLLDHHFAERQPDHVHIYRGERIVEHVHPYGLAHAHDTRQKQQPAIGSGHVAGIVYLISPDASGPGSISLNAGSVSTEISFSDFGNSLLQLRSGDSDDPLTEIFSRVPQKPPLA